MDMKLEVVVVPVSDVDRAKDFYATTLGWRLDADIAPGEGSRLVQVTPAGSACSVQFGKAVTSAAPGSLQDLFLAVSDIEAVRKDLTGTGVEVSEVFHCGTGFACRFDSAGPEGRASGPAPERRSYSSFARFSDPDGNGRVLQEITERLPGR
jgi:catechol 2,3-dioxygenase-like lactoylglutathione lyase family enzyme